MKKIIFLATFVVILLALMAMPASTAVKKATLINAAGEKVVVEVGSYRAQLFFGVGYVLMTGKLGAIPGPDIYADVVIHGTFTYGKEALATSTTSTTYTMVEKDLQPYSMIDLMVNTGATTFTLPATSTMIRLLPDLGSTREWVFHNATSSSGITLTLAAGTGMDLVAVTNADDVIDPGEWTRLNCRRIYYRSADNENIMCIVDELANAD